MIAPGDGVKSHLFANEAVGQRDRVLHVRSDTPTGKRCSHKPLLPATGVGWLTYRRAAPRWRSQLSRRPAAAGHVRRARRPLSASSSRSIARARCARRSARALAAVRSAARPVRYGMPNAYRTGCRVEGRAAGASLCSLCVSRRPDFVCLSSSTCTASVSVRRPGGRSTCETMCMTWL